MSELIISARAALITAAVVTASIAVPVLTIMAGNRCKTEFQEFAAVAILDSMTRILFYAVPV